MTHKKFGTPGDTFIEFRLPGRLFVSSTKTADDGGNTFDGLLSQG